jgi:PAS domain S-box-containing protein
MKAEQVLNNKELDKFKLALDHAPVAVFIMDKNWNFEYINPEFEKLSGFTREELLHKNIGETLYKNVQGIPESRREIITHLNEGKSWKGELLTINNNGSTYWAETTASPYKNEKGEVDGYIVIQNDVTESHRMQDALLRSERRFRELTEMLPQAIYELDVNNHPLFMNRAGLNMFGLVPGASQSKMAFEFFSPNDTQKMKEALDRESKNIRYENGVLQPFASEPAEYMANRTDGSAFPVIVYGTPIVEEGEVKGSRGIIIDISERKAIENALRESEKKYKTLVENSLDGIIIVRNNQILFMNDTFCNMLGYSCELIYNTPSTNFIHPQDRDRVLAIAEQRKLGDFSIINDSLRLVRADGEVLDCEVFSSFIEYEGLPAVFFTIHNVTENRRMQKALRENEEKYRSFIEKATDGIVITQDGKLKFSNAAMHDMMQYSEEEMFERSFFDFVIPEDHEEMRQYHIRRMRGERFNALYRSHFIRKDHKIITVELNARTLVYEGKPAAFIVIRDITERLVIEDQLKLAKDELEELNKNLEERIKESSESLTEARTQLIRLQKENLQSQFEVLRQQVNPHFLFNSLNVLTSLIKLEPDLAEKFTEHLSKVYRYVLENKDNDLVDLKTELDFLDAYLFLLNIRFMDKIVVTINIDKEKHEMLILPLALQLLIENAIKHNSMSKKNPLCIDLFINENNFLNVVNNLQERESYIASTGVGLKNIEHRYKLLEMPAPEFIKTETSFIAKIPLKENTK